MGKKSFDCTMNPVRNKCYLYTPRAAADVKNVGTEEEPVEVITPKLPAPNSVRIYLDYARAVRKGKKWRTTEDFWADFACCLINKQNTAEKSGGLFAVKERVR